MERLKIDSVDDCNKDLGAKIVRLSSAMVGFVVGFGAETVRWWFQWGSQCRNGWCSSSLTSIPMLGLWVGCWGHGVWLLCGSLWIAYLGFKISDCVYLCALGLGILRVRFLGFFCFFFFFNCLLVFWLSLRLLWWWLWFGHAVMLPWVLFLWLWVDFLG